jgi:hypothetical protein
MENLKDLYLELADLIDNNISEIKHIDLWHNQVNFLEEEIRFESPAVFLEFRATSVEDTSLKSQRVTMQVNVFLFYETFLETHQGAYAQSEAVAFLDIFTKIHKLLHGTDGVNYSSMRRIGFSPVDTGSASNLYQMPFNCLVNDVSALVEGDDLVDEDQDGQNEFQEFQPNL